jgi:pentapeptide MXKDX repeat protein
MWRGTAGRHAGNRRHSAGTATPGFIFDGRMRVKTVLKMVLAGLMAVSMMGAYAADDMMKKDGMSKDAMKKDEMKKDGMMKKDEMKK